jgi:hypothetical protein
MKEDINNLAADILKQITDDDWKEIKKNYPDIQGYTQVKDTEYWFKKLGKNFRSLILHTDFNKWKDKPKWQAKANKNVSNFGKSIVGDTPAEALQNLYIELKKANRI